MTNHEKRSDDPATVAIAATFVAELVQSSLTFWLRELGIRSRIVFSPYNQVFQQLIDPASVFNANSGGFNVILVRIEDWARLETGGAQEADFSASLIERTVDDLRRALITTSERTVRPFVIVLCPASRTLRNDPEQAMAFKHTELRIASELSHIQSVQVVSSQDLAMLYPVAEYDDPHANRLAHIPYTGTFFTALGTMIARRIASMVYPRRKAIVLDCDETLWGGSCGEDGATGVRIDEVRVRIQQFMIRQFEAGMLLCLCSKNNEADVFEVFDQRAEMLLKRDHIISYRINWNPKSENIKSLAKELNIGLDSFIFLDDNPLECAEVQANCPQVLTLRLPEDATSASTFLNHLWLLDPIGQSDEARRRTDLYRNNAQRDRLRSESITFKEFFDSLDLEVEITALTADDVARVAELTQRTNQFNIAPIRRSESEVRDLCRPGGAESLIIRARDRFGDYGTVGVMMFNVAEGRLSVDTFLLSCRALGRGVEHRMLAKLGQIASERGLEAIDLRYHPTDKNRPALAFLDSVGPSFKERSGDDYFFRFPSEFAMRVTFAADAVDRTAGLPKKSLPDDEASVATNAPKADLWGLIAEEMHDIERIHSIVSAQREVQSTSTVPFVAPRVPVEQTLAAIYSELLGIDQIGVYDNFFDLGGHSLLAMQVLSRVRETFRVEIPVGVLFTSEFTINDLAREIGKNRIEQAEPEQLDDVLQHLDALSEDEVKSILAPSNPPYPEHEPE